MSSLLPSLDTWLIQLLAFFVDGLLGIVPELVVLVVRRTGLCLEGIPALADLAISTGSPCTLSCLSTKWAFASGCGPLSCEIDLPALVSVGADTGSPRVFTRFSDALL